MEIKIKNEKLRKILKQKMSIIKTLKAKGKEAIKLQEELDSLAVKRNNVVAQSIDIVENMDLNLKQFEAVESVEIKGGDVIITTFDVVEEFKKNYLKEQEDAKKANEVKDNKEVKDKK